DAIRARSIENHVLAGWQQALEAIFESDHFPTKLFRREHHPSQHRVQSRTIAAARQDADAWFHGSLGPERFFWIDWSARSCPLVVDCPAAREGLCTFTE